MMVKNHPIPQKHAKVQEKTCAKCGKRFLICSAGRRQSLSTNCRICRREEQRLQEEKQKTIENREWKKKKDFEAQMYISQLPNWNVVSRESIHPKAGQVLYILGNGFDLMHRVPSSYYSFRDSLGKNCALRSALENFWTPEDLWADFENALAKFNAEAMSASHIVDSWMSTCGVYDEDSGAAEFSLAIEGATHPIMTVVQELPRRFRMWVESLKVGTADRPLQCLFLDGKVLCFNYTEFVEELYGVSRENVCYIHGCRRKKKGEAKEKLVLGHLPGANQEAFDFLDIKDDWCKNSKKRCLVETAQAYVIQRIAECDEELTKHSSEIIARHRAFFDELSDVRDIIVIGHSLSQVDWEYFEAVCGGLSDRQAVHWYFGCHGLRDLESIEKLIAELRIPHNSVSLFRTDDIAVKPLPDSAPAQIVPRQTNDHQSTSIDAKWTIRIHGLFMEILDDSDNVKYDAWMPWAARRAIFTPSGENLFVIARGSGAGILLFRRISDSWVFVDELEGIPNQGIINPRLKRVFLNRHTITFVYNSRIRTYDLQDGRLIKNQAERHAGDRQYEGEDISCLILK